MSKRIFIIAEAGVNHNGSLETAKHMIDAAASAECDAVKFQTFSAEELVTENAPQADYQRKGTGSVTQSEMLKKLELSWDMHKELKKYCTEKGIIFLSSPFDHKSIDLLNEMGVEMLKIPSGEISNLPYLRKAGALGKRIILSTGMSDLKEVEKAVGILTDSGTKKENITVLHCNTGYPTPAEDVNLKAMVNMRESLGVDTGYSDHTLGIEAAVAAAAMGASVIEKHFTLDRNMEGPDHRASLLPGELKTMVEAVRRIEILLGDGIKKASPSEKNNMNAVRKSIVAARDIKRGERFTEDAISAKRPGTGISPMKWDEVVGTSAKKDFKKGENIEL